MTPELHCLIPNRMMKKEYQNFAFQLAEYLPDMQRTRQVIANRGFTFMSILIPYTGRFRIVLYQSTSESPQVIWQPLSESIKIYGGTK